MYAMLYCNYGSLLDAAHVSSDMGSNFTSQLTRDFHRRMGCAPIFSSPYHPSANGLAEHSVGNVKSIISRVAMDRDVNETLAYETETRPRHSAFGPRRDRD